mmetsp:Transcript_9306/g.17755  ORF Transcript_9306/g.17755 Transcript_9306/m.17755 type:complete len:228 (+) Transcript_9306:271-954(+)
MATPNKCEEFEPGDVTIFVMTSDDPDALALFPLVDIFPEVESLYVTDNAWNGDEFTTGEGTIQLEIPDEGIKAATVFGYGECVDFGDNWTLTNANDPFDFSARGDQLFVYCLASDGSPHFIWGFNYNGDWAPQNLTDYGTNTSALPDELVDQGNVALPHCDNYLWTDPTPEMVGNRTVQRAKFLDPLNYQCDNEMRYVLTLGECDGANHVATSWLVAIGIVTWMFWT